MCQSIIAHKLFDYVVLAFIFSNCITVALERPKILQGSLVNPSATCLCVRSYNSFCVVAFCILWGWIHLYYLNGAVSKLLLPLIAPSPRSDCQLSFSTSCLSVQERVFLTISNYIFTAIFVGEMTLKVTFYSLSLYYCQWVLSVVCGCATQRHLILSCLSPPVSLCLSLSQNWLHLSAPIAQPLSLFLLSWQFPCCFGE